MKNVEPRPGDWEIAPRPNYRSNKDLRFPYSELPFVGQYYLYKTNDLIEPFLDLVDFWGEGRINDNGLLSGFTEAININHQYQLVSNGPDKRHKIPNRIPTVNYSNVSTAGYIPDSSVTNLTLMGAPIVENCAVEISRLIRKDLGVIIIYGFNRKDEDIKVLEKELKKIHFYYHPGYALASPFNEITLFRNHLAYVNAEILVNHCIAGIENEKYSQVKEMVKSLYENDETIAIKKIIDAACSSYRVFPFGYELLKDDSTKEIIPKLFPLSIKQIITSGAQMSLTNVKFKMPLKVGWNADGEGDRTAYGGDARRGIEPTNKERFYWKLSPIDGGKYFSITNVKFTAPLKVGWNADGEGDRTAYGGDSRRGIEPTNKERFYWMLTPINKGQYFSLTNEKFKMPLKVGWNADGEGDRKAFGGDAGRGIEPTNKERFYWSIQSE
jgi:hypothetical protein